MRRQVENSHRTCIFSLDLRYQVETYLFVGWSGPMRSKYLIHAPLGDNTVAVIFLVVVRRHLVVVRFSVSI